ncbi:hypothetical protein MSG28_007338 [Choristoneura fumiferana]|uniref:Uncharacterized protein n=1 Tax=Choristoneura fumiferana TaxID=7141 RepID=A0ACC0JWM3_CHOFU|nr:hypothetical protein MSG28_007338 [Choristoneura fumiferana]
MDAQKNQKKRPALGIEPRSSAIRAACYNPNTTAGQEFRHEFFLCIHISDWTWQHWETVNTQQASASGLPYVRR